MEKNEASNIRVQDLDHCGIIAGICDEMGLVEQIDRLLGTHPQEIISPGQAVKAMILNGLGFVSAPLYLFEKFFVGKATEHLLGEGIKPEHLNDDRLGRILDKLYGYGLTEMFVTIALAASGEKLWSRSAQPTRGFEFDARRWKLLFNHRSRSGNGWDTHHLWLF
jgi:transposase